LALVLMLCPLLTVGGAAASLSEVDWSAVDWQDLIENKVVPAAVMGISLVGSVYVAFITVKNKVLAASAKFERASETANASASAANESAKLSAEAREATARFQEELAARMERLEKRQTEEVMAMRVQMECMARETEKMEDMLRVGFGNIDELVAKGSAREALKLLEDSNGKENA